MIEIPESARKLMQAIEQKGYAVVVKRSPLGGYEVIAIHSETGERIGGTAANPADAASDVADLLGISAGATDED